MVSVPLVVTFIITRVLVLALPMSGGNDSARPRPTLFSLSIAVPIFVGMSLSFAMLPSSAVYALIGLREIAKGSLELSAAGLLLGLGSFVLAITIAVFASKPVANLLQFVWLKTVELFWNVLRFPTEISIRIYGDFGRPMSPSH